MVISFGCGPFLSLDGKRHSAGLTSAVHLRMMDLSRRAHTDASLDNPVSPVRYRGRNATQRSAETQTQTRRKRIKRPHSRVWSCGTEISECGMPHHTGRSGDMGAFGPAHRARRERWKTERRRPGKVSVHESDRRAIPVGGELIRKMEINCVWQTGCPHSGECRCKFQKSRTPSACRVHPLQTGVSVLARSNIHDVGRWVCWWCW